MMRLECARHLGSKKDDGPGEVEADQKEWDHPQTPVDRIDCQNAGMVEGG